MKEEQNLSSAKGKILVVKPVQPAYYFAVRWDATTDTLSKLSVLTNNRLVGFIGHKGFLEFSYRVNGIKTGYIANVSDWLLFRVEDDLVKEVILLPDATVQKTYIELKPED